MTAIIDSDLKKAISKKKLGSIALVDTLSVFLWLITMILSTLTDPEAVTFLQAVEQSKNLSFLYLLTHINAVIFTLLTTLLFAGLFLYYKAQYPALALMGLVFVPVYCLMNLFSYGSQVFILPYLTPLLEEPGLQPAVQVLVGQMTRKWQTSIVMVINLGAYALLSIPSFIYGYMLVKDELRYLQLTGWLIVMNGISCLGGFIIGILIVNSIELVGISSILGGVLFTLSLIPLCKLYFE
ncbi:MAG: hypothetical protein ACFFD4_06160 [Candidatus Odinarchaeota archaeon]